MIIGFLVGVVTNLASKVLSNQISHILTVQIETSSISAILILAVLTLVIILATLAYAQARNVAKKLDELLSGKHWTDKYEKSPKKKRVVRCAQQVEKNTKKCLKEGRADKRTCLECYIRRTRHKKITR